MFRPYLSWAALMRKAFTVTHRALKRKNRSAGRKAKERKSSPSTSSTPRSITRLPSQSEAYSFLWYTATVMRFTMSTSVLRRAVPVLRVPPA